MADQIQVSAQVLQSTLANVVGLLSQVYSDVAGRVGANAAQYPTFTNLKPAIDAVNSGAYQLATGQMDPQTWAGGVNQSIDAMVLVAGQLKQTGVDPQGQALTNANSAKVAIAKALGGIGLSGGPSKIVVGVAALALALAGAWAWKKMKPQKRRGMAAMSSGDESDEDDDEDDSDDDSDDDDESTGEQIESNDDDDESSTPWKRASKKRLRWSRMSA